jgi:YidC/Oxa1 family membrane protein insertase
MNNRRLILYILLAFVVFSLWSAWQKDYGPKPITEQPTAKADQAVPTLAKPKTTITVAKIPAKRIIHARTDVLDVAIDTLGGNVISAKLLKYPADLKTPAIPIQILTPKPDELYIAQSGLIGVLNHKPLQYTAAQKKYILSPDQKELQVKLSGRNGRGLLITKTFKFTQGSYAIDVNYQINNQSGKNWSGQFYTQIKRKKPAAKGGMFILHTFTGAAISSPEKPYEKLSYAKLDKEELARDISGGWLAMQQRYFLSAWIPDQNKTHHYYSHVDDDVYTIGMTNGIDVAAGKQNNFGAKFYVGPEIQKNLAPLANHLDLTIDYGWLWIISVAMFWLLQHIYNFVGNWGWAIVILTILIKLVFYKFSEKSYISMAKMRTLAPKIKALKERYGDDKQKMSQATMELYKKEKINPLGGCLPQLIQIPFFIALYYVLIEAVQLRQAPFIFWIHDLAVRDPYFILPVLMGICMFLTQKLTPMSPDPSQQKMMMFMPVIFTVLFASFPAGLVLYWLVNYLVSGLQQWYIIRKYERQQKKVRA